MAGRNNGRVYPYVLVDLNTQADFCHPEGMAPVSNAAVLLPALQQLFAWAGQSNIPVISSAESHRRGDLSDSAGPICCLDGSHGQRKLEFTLLPDHARLEVDNTLSCPLDVFRRTQQVILRKRSEDLLANPKADRLFSQLPVEEYVLFGVSPEGSIKALGLGLRARGKPVTVVTDACGYWDASCADLALRQLEAKGAVLTNLQTLLERPLERAAPRTRAGVGKRLAHAVRTAVRTRRPVKAIRTTRRLSRESAPPSIPESEGNGRRRKP